MADPTPETVEQSGALSNLAALPLLKQGGILIGLAASIAIGFWVVLWAQEPDYQVLFNQVDEKELSELSSTLDSAQIKYKLNMGSGAVLVGSGDITRARILLASKGLPRSSATGFDILEKDDGFGISQFREKARYHRAMEGELAQSITSIRSVRSTRVHLAIPKQSVFVRKKTKPTASVVVDLYAGRNLDSGQVAAIVHMVASAIPNMESGQVSVIDQNGRLLTTKDGGDDMALSVRQLGFVRSMESSYEERIQNILEPFIGVGKVRAQVSATIDFTSFEETTEDFTPEKNAIRSEQLSDEQSGKVRSMGVPGALSNNADALGDDEGEDAKGYLNSRKTRNYELDRTVRHTKKAAGDLKYISIAVVVDEPMEDVVAADGAAEGEEVANIAPKRRPLTTEEMVKIRSLVVNAVGFDEKRGDLLTVTSAPFYMEKVEALPEIPLMKQPWVAPLAKQVLAGVVVLLLILMVLKPLIGNLSTPAPVAAMGVVAGGAEQGAVGGAGGLVGDSILNGEVPPGYEERLQVAQGVINGNSQIGAQVVRNWSGGESE